MSGVSTFAKARYHRCDDMLVIERRRRRQHRRTLRTGDLYGAGGAAQTVKNTADDLKLEGLTGNSFTLAVARDTGGSGWIDLNGL